MTTATCPAVKLPQPLVLRAVCFDIGDTLVFDRPSRDERIADALSASGVMFSAERFQAAMADVEREGLRRYLSGAPPDSPAVALDLARLLIARLTGDAGHAHALAADVLQRYIALPFERIVPPGAIALLQDLRARGFKLAAISDWEADLPDLLRGLALFDLFDALSVSSHVGATKPSRILFDDALSKLQVEPAQALHVGDYYELDFLGARAAGMLAVVFDARGRYGNAGLGAPVVQTFAELQSYLSAAILPQ